MDEDEKSEGLRTAVCALRAPLSGILGSVEMLRLGPLDAQQVEIVRALSADCAELLSQLDDISDVVRLDGSRLAVERVHVELSPVLEQALAAVAAKAEERGMAVLVERLPNAPSAVMGDPARVLESPAWRRCWWSRMIPSRRGSFRSSRRRRGTGCWRLARWRRLDA